MGWCPYLRQMLMLSIIMNMVCSYIVNMYIFWDQLWAHSSLAWNTHSLRLLIVFHSLLSHRCFQDRSASPQHLVVFSNPPAPPLQDSTGLAISIPHQRLALLNSWAPQWLNWAFKHLAWPHFQASAVGDLSWYISTGQHFMSLQEYSWPLSYCLPFITFKYFTALPQYLK